MDSSDHRKSPRSILIVKADQVYAEALGHLAASVFPAAKIKLATSNASARLASTAEPFDLLVTGLGVELGGDMLDFLSNSTGNSRFARVLVVTTHHESRVLAVLQALGVQGVFDSTTEDGHKLALAMAAVARGEYYRSQSILKWLACSAVHPPLSRILTNCEQLVLSVIGDGSDDLAAARELCVSPATICCVRRNLHRKLDVQHRGELMRVAAQNGFVRFSSSGVIRTGFNLLLAAHQPRKRKRVELTAA